MQKPLPLRASAIPPQGLCRTGRFVLDAPLAQRRRCRHPHARSWGTTRVAVTPRGRPPQERKAHHDCPDGRPWRCWERLRMLDPAFLGVGGLLLGTRLGVGFVSQGSVTYGPIYPF
jgi:hypothetical protein